MDLSSITIGKTPKPRRAMVYGVHGVGKSTFASKAPSPIFIQTEEGLGEIDVAKFPLAKTCKDVGDSLRALRDENHEYKTVVIDSLDWLERLIWQLVIEQKKVKNIEDIGYAKGYVFALEYWSTMLGLLGELREKGMGCILIAHSKIEKFENPETESYDRYSPRLHKLASSLVQEWCDEVLFATFNIFTKTSEEGFNSKRVIAMGTGERVLKTGDRPSHVAKNRLSLPPEIPMEYSAYAEYFNG